MARAVIDEHRALLSAVEVLLIEQTVELTRIAASTLGDGTVANRAIQVLLAVHSDTGARPSEIATRNGMARSSVARALRSLEERGLVSRTPDRADRRAMHLVVTADGRRRISSFQRELGRYFETTAPIVHQLLDALGTAVLPSDGVHVSPLDAAAALAGVGAAYVDDVQNAIAPFGITHAADRQTIALLREHGGLRPSELASTLHLTTGGVSQLVDRLEGSDLVRRTHPTDGDRRTVVVTLTDRGDEAAAALLDCLDRHLPAICSALVLTTRVDAVRGVALP
jgi:DNA-binding MarR family transcriptional regulator